MPLINKKIARNKEVLVILEFFSIQIAKFRQLRFFHLYRCCGVEDE